MKILEVLNEASEDYTIKKTGSSENRGDTEKYEPDVVTTTFNILQKGKIVGELKHEDYTGNLHGHLHNKFLPNLSNYDRGEDDPLNNLNAFLKSKSGQKWMSNIEKYKTLSAPTNDYRIKR